MPPPFLTVLRSYAQKSNPTTLPPSILFSHSPTTITIFDAYPKSLFHFLILPRPSPSLNVFDLSSLRTLLKKDKGKAREVILDLKDEAEKLKVEVEKEMKERYGFVWDVWMGFHAVPSMEYVNSYQQHLHLHVISADLTAPGMKNKKHYNSFHPDRGFFLHLKDIVALFDAEPSAFDSMAELKPSQYEQLLKQDLVCFRCNKSQKNMPALKEHLQTEWDRLREREKARPQTLREKDDNSETSNVRKREREDNAENTEDEDLVRKRREVDEGS